MFWQPDKFGKAAYDIEATYFCDETSTMYNMRGEEISAHKEKCLWNGTWSPNEVLTTHHIGLHALTRSKPLRTLSLIVFCLKQAPASVWIHKILERNLTISESQLREDQMQQSSKLPKHALILEWNTGSLLRLG